MVPMELTDASVPAKKGYLGNKELVIPAGKHLRIETSPDGDEVLDAVVPAGKVWTVQIHMTITETDA